MIMPGFFHNVWGNLSIFILSHPHKALISSNDDGSKYTRRIPEMVQVTNIGNGEMNRKEQIKSLQAFLEY